MKKNIIITILFISIGLILQIILIGTSPKINCNEVWNQLHIFLKILVVEYLILVAIQSVFICFIKKGTNKELFYNLLFFTIAYLVVFVCLFNNYRQEICR